LKKNPIERFIEACWVQIILEGYGLNKEIPVVTSISDNALVLDLIRVEFLMFVLTLADGVCCVLFVQVCVGVQREELAQSIRSN
jgi:hypothetical protein